MRSSPGKVLSSGTAICSETWRYSYATAEYSGLVSLSYIRCGGAIVARPVSRVTSPIFKLASKAYRKTADGVGRAYGKTASGASRLAKAIPIPGRRMRNLEEKFQQIEERLLRIEEHGVVMPGLDAEGKRKKLSEDKKMLLKNILLENIDLKD